MKWDGVSEDIRCTSTNLNVSSQSDDYEEYLVLKLLNHFISISISTPILSMDKQGLTW